MRPLWRTGVLSCLYAVCSRRTWILTFSRARELNMRQALAIACQGPGIRLQRFLHYTGIGTADHRWHLTGFDEILNDRGNNSMNYDDGQSGRSPSSCPKFRHLLDRHESISWWHIMIKYQVYDIGKVFAARM